MGFTAVDGLMMGTRCGALDPGVLLYLMQERGHRCHGHRGSDLSPVGPARRLGHLLRHAHLAPVEGARGGRGDRPLRLPHRARDRLAWRPPWAGSTAWSSPRGIGENDAATRAEVVAGCGWLGLQLDTARNSVGEGRISTQASRVSAWVVPTDEERMIARYTSEFVAAASRR